MSPRLKKLTDEQNAWSFYSWESVKRRRQFISRAHLMQLEREDFNLAHKTKELDHRESWSDFNYCLTLKKLKNREVTSKRETN